MRRHAPTFRPMTEPALDSPRNADHALQLSLEARPENVAVVRQVLGGAAAALGMEGRAVDDLRLALSEACTNVVVHAYEHPELARRFALFGIPGFVLFKDGRKLGMMRQYYGREYWQAVIDEKATEPVAAQG